MQHGEIIYRLGLAGKNQVQLALELRVTRGQINNVIKGRVKSVRIAKYIASLINCKINEISEIYHDMET